MIITLGKCLVPECGGADHRFEFERPTLREVERIQTATGLDFDAWLEGVNAGMGGGFNGAMIPSVIALVDILHRRIGVRAAWDDIDVDLYHLDFEMEPGEVDAAAGGEQPDGDGEEGGEGKGPDLTSPSHQPAEPDDPASPGSGPGGEAAPAPSSSPMQTASGSASASP